MGTLTGPLSTYHDALFVNDRRQLEGIRENLIFRNNVPVNDHFCDLLKRWLGVITYQIDDDKKDFESREKFMHY
jgi:hypothetical protein